MAEASRTDDADTTDVLVAGGGPAGLTLACELALAGVRTTVLERHAAPPGFCRGFNLNARSLDLLELRGLADRFLAEGPTRQQTMFVGGSVLDLAAMRTGHPYVLGIAQTRVEELIAEQAVRSGARIRRGHRLVGLRQDDGGVTAEVESSESAAGRRRLRCRWLVGCDGGRSTVRRLTGIGFPGTPARHFTLLGDVTLADAGALPLGATSGPGGSLFAIPRPGYVRLITADRQPPDDKDEPVTLHHFQEVVDRVVGRHVEIAEAHWLSRFGDATRLAERLRHGRVLLAGDAAHIHPPAGAIGVNAAIDDAMNLGWKLALVARDLAPDDLLETYHTEQHAAGARLLRNSRAQAVFSTTEEEGDEQRLAPVRELLAELAETDETAGHLAETFTGVGARHPVHDPSGHAWEGRMVPNIPLRHGGRLTALTALTEKGGGAVLLDGEPEKGRWDEVAAPWADRVAVARTRPGELPGAYAVLVRPDGHAAWVGADPAAAERDVERLSAALRDWFGPPRDALGELKAVAG